MIIYQGKKYACINCIRGHRSSSCDHRDRVLIQVRKRGRPLPKTDRRHTLIPAEKQPDYDNEAHRRLIIVNSASGRASDDDDGGPIYTEKWIFEPAGCGLYRKRPNDAGQTSDSGNPDEVTEQTKSPATSVIDGDVQTIDPQFDVCEFDLSGDFKPLLSKDAQLIAPMDYNGLPLSNFGVTSEEAEQFWPNSNDLTSIPSCVLPDQCHCGPDCACEGCYTHSRKSGLAPGASR